MAIPSIPTSFVPHSSSAAAQNRRVSADISGAFVFIGYAALLVTFLLAIGIFFYERVLTTEKSTKDAELAKAQKSIDPKATQDFTRLRDRLNASQGLLTNHTSFSGFFSAFDKIVPETVTFSSLEISVEPDGTAKVVGKGIAKDFNSLAVTSIAFAADARMKNSIFSDIQMNKDSTISFSLSAPLDPKALTSSP